MLDESEYFNADWDHAARRVMSPPFRAKAHQESLWAGLQCGSLQVVATDHCSFTDEQKRLGRNDFHKIPNGTGGLEDRMPVLWSEGVATGRLTREEFVAVTSANIARILNIYPRKGAVAVGSDADLVIFDPAATKTITAKKQVSRIEYNVFEGCVCNGAPVATIASGKLAWRPGELRAAAGDGRYVARPPSPPAMWRNTTWRAVQRAARRRARRGDAVIPNLKIDPQRLWDTLMDTAQIGGTPKGGIRRLTLTDEDKRVRDWFRQQCEALGCTVTVDEVGTMFARREGKDPNAAPIAMGSHLDTQPTGGKFDGALGVLAGLEVLRTLHDLDYRTNAPLELVNWTNEEGSRFAPAMLGVRRLRRRVHARRGLRQAGSRRRQLRRGARRDRLSGRATGRPAPFRRPVRTAYRAGSDPGERGQDDRRRHRRSGHALVRGHRDGPGRAYRRDADVSAQERAARRRARHRSDRRHRARAMRPTRSAPSG